MNLHAPIPKEGESISGFEQIRAVMEGRTEYKGIVHLLGLKPAELEEGRVVFEGTPTREHYNPIGTVHGGYAATMLDTVMGCAVQSKLKAGQGFTTLELKVAYHRAMTERTGTVRAEGRLLSFGRRAAFVEARLTDSAGRLIATATSTCMVLSNDHDNL